MLRTLSLVLLAAAVPALATGQLRLESSSPADGDTLTTSPDAVRLTFDAPIREQIGMILSGEGQAWILEASPDPSDRRSALARVPRLARSGDYRLAYRAVRAESLEAVEDAISFHVRLPPGSEGAPGADESSARPLLDAVGGSAVGDGASEQAGPPVPGYVIVGLVAFAVLALAALILYLVRRSALKRRPPPEGRDDAGG